MQQERLVVRLEDYLGRSVSVRHASDRKLVCHAKQHGRLHPRSLHPKSGDNDLSVDKLMRSPSSECGYSADHVRVAENREGTFYGWGTFTRESLETNTPCRVIPDPIPDLNPNHVLIKFPEVVKTCNKIRNAIAQELANLSKWLEYRDPPSDWF